MIYKLYNLKYIDLEVNEENINKLITAAGIKVESYWPKLFASMIKERGMPRLFGDGMLIDI